MYCEKCLNETDTWNACDYLQRQHANGKLTTFSLYLCCISGNQKKSMAKHMSMLNHICREPGPTAAPALAGQRDEKKARHGQTCCVFPISKTPNGALCACLLCLIHCGSLAFPSFIIFDFRFYCYSFWNFGSGLCWAPARQFGALLWPWSPPTVCSVVWCFFATVSAIRCCGCHLILLPCKDVESQKRWASLCN